MGFRWRLFFALLVAALVPLAALSLLVRDEMTERLGAQYERRVEALVRVIEEDLAGESGKTARSLAAMAAALAEDNRFRRAAVDGAEEQRRYLLDCAGHAMGASGLSMLQIQDEAGRILSSGHFRNDYDRMEPELPALVASAPGASALVEARSPDGVFLAFARVDSLRAGSRRFTVVGGSRVDERFLARLVRDADMTVTLVYAGGEMREESGRREIIRELSVPFIDARRESVERAAFVVTHDLGGLSALERGVDRWVLAAAIAAVLLAAFLAGWLSSRLSRPIAELAVKASRVDLERLDVDFASARKDEIGVLSRGLGGMIERLRASAAAVKEAERRATLSEVARQVNHDIKNGLAPIRNVFRHLSDLARDRPDELHAVFRERKDTVDSSISYLEKLATNYARLSPRRETGPCDVNETVRRVVADRRFLAPVVFETTLCEGAVVAADPLSLRRVLENLADNAIDSLEGRGGTVSIKTALVPDDGGREPVCESCGLRDKGAERGGDANCVRIAVSDTGAGMGEDELARIFDDFYTTKPHGTGLGLSIVRRLVMDLGGSIRVESEKGKGSRFTVELPRSDAP